MKNPFVGWGGPNGRNAIGDGVRADLGLGWAPAKAESAANLMATSAKACVFKFGGRNRRVGENTVAMPQRGARPLSSQDAVRLKAVVQFA